MALTFKNSNSVQLEKNKVHQDEMNDLENYLLIPTINIGELNSILSQALNPKSLPLWGYPLRTSA